MECSWLRTISYNSLKTKSLIIRRPDSQSEILPVDKSRKIPSETTVSKSLSRMEPNKSEISILIILYPMMATMTSEYLKIIIFAN
jgi:hypothetical protein